jgi:hypothetical protein
MALAMLASFTRLEEDGFNLNEASLRQGRDSDASACGELRLVVLLVDFIYLRKIIHIDKVYSVLHCVLLKVKPIVCGEILQINQNLLCLRNNLIFTIDKITGLGVQSKLARRVSEKGAVRHLDGLSETVGSNGSRHLI